MKFGLSQPVRRREDPRFLTGRGRYVDDITLPAQAHAAVLRSPVAHGRLRVLDVAAARAMPGVLAVYTHAEIADRLAPLGNDIPLEPPAAPVTMPHLAAGRVRFVGEPVAFVVAETRAAAEEAAEAIALEIDELEPVVDPEAALAAGAPQLHGEAPGNLAYTWECGDAEAVEAAFARAARVVSTPFLCQRLVVAPMEPRAINIRYDAESGRWEGWVSCQGAHMMRGMLARSLKVKPDRIRIHVPDVGGAFGMKLMNHPEYALAALAAKDTGRPVKWIGSRSESFLSDSQARDLRGTVEGAFDAEGRCLALRLRGISGLGAYYSSFGAGIHTVFSAALLGGLYRVGAIHAEVRGVFTNTTPMDAYRGAGRPEVIYATERLMAAAARAFGLDPVEIRRRNLLTAGEVPHESPGGLVFDSLDTERVLARALAKADYAGFEGRWQEARARGAWAGIGVAYYMERTGGPPFERARLALAPDGRLRIWVGTQSSGQGHETAWAQIAREKLGLPIEAIELMAGDSDALAKAGFTGGSRSAIMAGRVVLDAGERLIEKARPLAAEMLEAAEADLEFSAPEGGIFRIAGTDRTVTLVEVAREAGGLEAEGAVDDTTSTFPNGCHVAEVEIDGDTGRLSLVRYSVVDDLGRLVNPLLAAGQIHGGIAQGAGQVLGEAMVWDPGSGQPLSASFMDYALPRAADLPAIEVEFVEVPCRTNPLGIKGCGEAGSVGAISAVALAVHDALARAGAAPIETPMTPERLWRALRGAAGQGAGAA